MAYMIDLQKLINKYQKRAKECREKQFKYPSLTFFGGYAQGKADTFDWVAKELARLLKREAKRDDN